MTNKLKWLMRQLLKAHPLPDGWAMSIERPIDIEAAIRVRAPSGRGFWLNFGDFDHVLYLYKGLVDLLTEEDFRNNAVAGEVMERLHP